MIELHYVKEWDMLEMWTIMVCVKALEIGWLPPVYPSSKTVCHQVNDMNSAIDFLVEKLPEEFCLRR